ncbi:hypothetical protein D3C76_01440 [compost metagenome]
MYNGYYCVYNIIIRIILEEECKLNFLSKREIIAVREHFGEIKEVKFDDGTSVSIEEAIKLAEEGSIINATANIIREYKTLTIKPYIK